LERSYNIEASLGEDYVKVHTDVKDIIAKVCEFTGDEGRDEPLPGGYSGRVKGMYKIMLSKCDDSKELLINYHIAFRSRCLTLKSLRKRLCSIVFEEIAKKIKSVLKAVTKASTAV
jgi:hypothetical protein